MIVAHALLRANCKSPQFELSYFWMKYLGDLKKIQFRRIFRIQADIDYLIFSAPSGCLQYFTGVTGQIQVMID